MFLRRNNLQCNKQKSQKGRIANINIKRAKWTTKRRDYKIKIRTAKKRFFFQ